MKNKITILAVSVLILLLTAAALLCGVWFFRSAWYGEAELLSMPYANGMPFLGNLHKEKEGRTEVRPSLLFRYSRCLR
jgi:flagellar basal body-associated protein FliL